MRLLPSQRPAIMCQRRGDADAVPTLVAQADAPPRRCHPASVVPALLPLLPFPNRDAFEEVRQQVTPAGASPRQLTDEDNGDGTTADSEVLHQSNSGERILTSPSLVRCRNRFSYYYGTFMFACKRACAM